LSDFKGSEATSSEFLSGKAVMGDTREKEICKEVQRIKNMKFTGGHFITL
jgi:hypothetical protein